MTATLRNIAKSDLSFWYEELDEHIAIVVKNAAGDTVGATAYGASVLPKKTEATTGAKHIHHISVHLKPGQECRTNLFVSSLYDMSLSGKYTITVSMHFPVPGNPPTFFEAGSNVIEVANLGLDETSLQLHGFDRLAELQIEDITRRAEQGSGDHSAAADHGEEPIILN